MSPRTHATVPRVAPLAAVLAVALATTAPVLAQSSAARLEGPVTGGARGGPFGAATTLPAGWVEEEWFVSGEASSYTKVDVWQTDGRWHVAPDETAPFTVRLLVRRPREAASFNGVVVVEWLNVTARSEGAADYMQMEEELLRGGYAWIGVGAQAVGIHAPGTGLKAWDAERYARLEHPGDRFSYDIFSHVARAARAASPDGPLGGLRPSHVLAAGRSQSAFRLVTYLNVIHPLEPLFDGYFVHSRGATAAGLRAEALAADTPDPIPPGAWIRSDIDVPVLDLQTEGDMVTLGAHRTRQPASATYRRWEIAGAAHAEVPLWIVEEPPALSRGAGCMRPVNAAPHHAFVKAGLRALVRWAADGVVPPQSPEIQLGDPASIDPIVRDEYGNAIGGVRIPQLEAPTATLDGRQNSVAAAAPGGQNFCSLFGNTEPFDAETLADLYPSHQAFVARYTAAVDALERDGYLLAPEAEAAREAAEASGIGR